MGVESEWGFGRSDCHHKSGFLHQSFQGKIVNLHYILINHMHLLLRVELMTNYEVITLVATNLGNPNHCSKGIHTHHVANLH